MNNNFHKPPTVLLIFLPRKLTSKEGGSFICSSAVRGRCCSHLNITIVSTKLNRILTRRWRQFTLNDLTTNIPVFFENRVSKDIDSFYNTWQLKATEFAQKPIKSLYMTPDSRSMIPRSIQANQSKFKIVSKTLLFARCHTNNRISHGIDNKLNET